MERYCLFHALPIQASNRIRGAIQPQANQLLEQLKPLIACVDLEDEDWKKQMLPIGFTDTRWLSGHAE